MGWREQQRKKAGRSILSTLQRPTLDDSPRYYNSVAQERTDEEATDKEGEGEEGEAGSKGGE